MVMGQFAAGCCTSQPYSSVMMHLSFVLFSFSYLIIYIELLVFAFFFVSCENAIKIMEKQHIYWLRSVIAAAFCHQLDGLNIASICSCALHQNLEPS